MHSSFPPRLSISVFAAARRFDPPSFSNPLDPSAVYDPCKRYFAITLLPPHVVSGFLVPPKPHRGEGGSRTVLPPKSNRVPKPESNRQPDGDERKQRGRDVWIDAQQQ